MKVSTEIDNNFGYEKITQLVDNIPLIYAVVCTFFITINICLLTVTGSPRNYSFVVSTDFIDKHSCLNNIFIYIICMDNFYPGTLLCLFYGSTWISNAIYRCLVCIVWFHARAGYCFPSQERERSCICMLVGYCLPLFLRCVDWILELFHLFVWGGGGLMSYLRYLYLFPYSCVQLCSSLSCIHCVSQDCSYLDCPSVFSFISESMPFLLLSLPFSYSISLIC
jgi:hypothetical protein